MSTLTGWLRKRPRFAGHWPSRFVQLTADGKLVIYTHDYTKATGDKQAVVALFTLVVPKNIKIDVVHDRMVRLKRNGIKNQKVFVIRARFKDSVLFTLGSNSEYF
jgi:hypothetical protein